MTTQDRANYHFRMMEKWKKIDTPTAARMAALNKREAEGYLQNVAIQNFYKQKDYGRELDDKRGRANKKG